MTVENNYKIIFVHGTWGKSKNWHSNKPKPANKRAWYQEGSIFYDRLAGELHRHKLSYDLDYLEWSGANSIVERDFATKRLAAKITELRPRPGQAVVIVAHSHGGNVAVRALQYFDSDLYQTRIITLATPFMEVMPIDGDKNYRTAFYWISSLGVGISLYFMSFISSMLGLSLTPFANSLIFPFFA